MFFPPFQVFEILKARTLQIVSGLFLFSATSIFSQGFFLFPALT